MVGVGPTREPEEGGHQHLPRPLAQPHALSPGAAGQATWGRACPTLIKTWGLPSKGRATHLHSWQSVVRCMWSDACPLGRTRHMDGGVLGPADRCLCAAGPGPSPKPACYRCLLTPQPHALCHVVEREMLKRAHAESLHRGCHASSRERGVADARGPDRQQRMQGTAGHPHASACGAGCDLGLRTMQTPGLT
jgi:hypothetical protein